MVWIFQNKCTDVAYYINNITVITEAFTCAAHSRHMKQQALKCSQLWLQLKCKTQSLFTKATLLTQRQPCEKCVHQDTCAHCMSCGILFIALWTKKAGLGEEIYMIKLSEWTDRAMESKWSPFSFSLREWQQNVTCWGVFIVFQC